MKLALREKRLYFPALGLNTDQKISKQGHFSSSVGAYLNSNKLDLMMMFISPQNCLFLMKRQTYINIKILNSMVILICPVLELKYLFWANLGSKIQDCLFRIKLGD